MNIAKESQKRGYSIDVCTLSWQGDIFPFLNVMIVPTRSFTNHGKAIAFARFVQKQKLKKPYALVIGFNKIPGCDVYYAGDTCLAERLKNKYALSLLLPRYRIYSQFEQSVFNKQGYTHIFFISERSKASYVHHYQTPEDRLHLLPPGINRNCIPSQNQENIRNQLRKKLGVQEDIFLLLFVGSGFKTKGLDRALLAISALPITLKQKVFFVVIGEDNPKPFLKLIRKIDLIEKVQIFQGRNDIPLFLWGSDLLIHPAYHETAGAILLEAMLAGLPVLTTDTCGFSHYVEEANAGKVVPSPFAQELLNQYLIEMLTSPERETWKKNGLRLAENPNLFNRAEKAADLIEAIAKKP
ncbi:MAG: glycosyltransferase family 4 protein [Gammaproteobacteria bacterium]|nr:glycosyltransferase family 4 protein [Gammaproteobacteria bacterium]